MQTASGKKWWKKTSFRLKQSAQLVIGELVWIPAEAYKGAATGPYRVERVERACPGMLCVRIVGMEDSGEFSRAWGSVLVPRYR